MSEHVLKNTQATLSVTFSAGAADGAVTATIVDAEGAAVSSGNATHGTAGTYTYVLPAQSAVKELTVTWAGTWSGVAESIQHQVEVVGGLLFTIAELRAFSGSDLSSTTTYPDETLADKRGEVTDLFERVCGESFVPRYRRWMFDGDGRQSLWLPNHKVTRILSVTVNGVAYTSPQIAALGLYQNGQLWNRGGWPIGSAPNNIIIGYEHGHVFPPGEIKKAALILSRYELVASELSDRTISLSSDIGTVRLSVPGGNYPTGLPVVDAALGRYADALVEVGA